MTHTYWHRQILLFFAASHSFAYPLCPRMSSDHSRKPPLAIRSPSALPPVLTLADGQSKRLNHEAVSFVSMAEVDKEPVEKSEQVQVTEESTIEDVEEGLSEDASSVRKGKRPMQFTGDTGDLDTLPVTDPHTLSRVEAGSSSRREEGHRDLLFYAIEEATNLLTATEKQLAPQERTALQTYISAGNSVFLNKEVKEYSLRYKDLENAMAQYRRSLHTAQGGSESETIFT